MADQVLRDLNLSSEEVQRFSKAMKDPQFMQLLNEYAQEISEPMNKEEADCYIKMMEERAKKGEFSMQGKELLTPQPSFCFKTRNQKTGSKFFINVCHSGKIEPPKSNPRADGSGADWDIPYGLSQIHKDKDKGGSDCASVDYVVNEEVCKRCTENKRFKQFVSETAIESVERSYNLQLTREIIYPKLKYKGPSQTPKMLTIPSTTQPMPAAVTGSTHCANDSSVERKKALEKVDDNQKKDCKSDIVGNEILREPKFEIIYRNGLDLGRFWMDNNIDSTTELEMPKEILLRVFLPEVMNACEVELDVSDSQALLNVPNLYKLQVKWRYIVDSSKGHAKFDKLNHKLEIVLPIQAACKVVEK